MYTSTHGPLFTVHLLSPGVTVPSATKLVHMTEMANENCSLGRT